MSGLASWEPRKGHGSEARARRHRRAGEKPCAACLEAETEASRIRHGWSARTRSEVARDMWREGRGLALRWRQPA